MKISHVTSTELNRNLSEHLDNVDGGATLIISRIGRPVAALVPITDLKTSEDKMTSSSAIDGLSGIEPILRPVHGRETLLRELLKGLFALGCRLTPPSGNRTDYANVHHPGVKQRIASVNVASGRTEFQDGSYETLGKSSLRFVHLVAGHKAAHPLETDGDRDAILAATRIEIARRRS